MFLGMQLELAWSLLYIHSSDSPNNTGPSRTSGNFPGLRPNVWSFSYTQSLLVLTESPGLGIPILGHRRGTLKKGKTVKSQELRQLQLFHWSYESYDMNLKLMGKFLRPSMSYCHLSARWHISLRLYLLHMLDQWVETSRGIFRNQIGIYLLSCVRVTHTFWKLRMFLWWILL